MQFYICGPLFKSRQNRFFYVKVNPTGTHREAHYDRGMGTIRPVSRGQATELSLSVRPGPARENAGRRPRQSRPQKLDKFVYTQHFQ